MKCKHCGQENSTKAGHIRGHQRYKCCACERHFTDTPPRGKPAAVKDFALYMYTLCNASLGMIGRTLGVSNVAVLKWVRAAASKLERPKVETGSTVIMVDEMWHFVNGKKTRFGSGKPIILCQNVLSNGSWVAVMMERSRDF